MNVTTICESAVIDGAETLQPLLFSTGSCVPFIVTDEMMYPSNGVATSSMPSPSATETADEGETLPPDVAYMLTV